jgi:hypothetical protein
VGGVCGRALCGGQPFLDRATTFHLISSHGRMEQLLFYSELIKDYERVVGHHMQRGDYEAALQVLSQKEVRRPAGSQAHPPPTHPHSPWTTCAPRPRLPPPPPIPPPPLPFVDIGVGGGGEAVYSRFPPSPC